MPDRFARLRRLWQARRTPLAHIPEKWSLISGLPDISASIRANRKHPICVVFRKGYAPTHESSERVACSPFPERVGE